jgi:hypothetical protein
VATNPLLAEINNLSPGAKAALASAHQAASQATAPPPLVPNSAPAAQPNAAVGPKALNPELWKAPAETPPPGLTPPNSGPMPAAIATPGPSEAPPSVMAPPGTIPADTAELARKESTGSGISQIHGMIENSRLGQAHPLLGKILGWGAQIPAELGDIAGSAVAPEITRNLPGTEYHHDVLVKQGQRQVAGDVENAQKQAQTQEAGAATQKTQEETAEMPGEQEEKKALNDAQIMNYLHPQAKTSFEAWRQQNPNAPVQDFFQAEQDVKPTKEPGGPKTIQKQIGGLPHTFAYDEATKDYSRDEGPTGEKPPVINLNADKGREFQEQERGRGLLDKAEGSYRTAQQGANGLRAMIDNANAGDKMSARMLPLEGALEITTANGVHRINRTEVDQYAGGGNAFDRLEGQLKGATTGVPFTKGIMASMKNLADIQEKGAYQNYKDAHASATRRYHLEDEQPLPEPGGGAPSGGGEYSRTATGKNGEKYGLKGGKWYDVKTGMEAK